MVVVKDEFEGASLVQLISHFGLDTIIIWYCMLMQKRVLFVGQPAGAVGNCCLAAPLLVAPLTGWSKIMTPYVALTDISPVMKKTYICGSTNLLFETKTGAPLPSPCLLRLTCLRLVGCFGKLLKWLCYQQLWHSPIWQRQGVHEEHSQRYSRRPWGGMGP